jgi:hypothetical protein
MQTHIRNTPCDNKYTTSGEGENEKRAYIYDHTYPGRERQGTQYRDDDMRCDRKISHHRKKEKEK